MSPTAHAPHQGFVWLFEKNQALVLRTLIRFGVRRADVEDFAQEVFTVAYKKLDTFEGRSAPSTWLYGIAIRVASDYPRRAWVRREVPLERSHDEGQEERLTEGVGLSQARAKLDRALDLLSPEHRITFVLFELEQLPMADIASLVGVPLQTAYARLYAARRHVQEAVEAMHTVSATKRPRMASARRSTAPHRLATSA